MSKRAKLTHHDPEAHARHLRRQLESLEKDNHTSISSVEGLVTVALTAQEEEGSTRKSRNRSKNIYSTKVTLSALLESSPITAHCYQNCQVQPSIYPARKFCSVCGYTSDYKCLKCGMKYCSTKCLATHMETRCLKWTA